MTFDRRENAFDDLVAGSAEGWIAELPLRRHGWLRGDPAEPRLGFA
jgi:hypothetical protein